MRLALSLLACAFTVSAGTPGPQLHWHKAGLTQQEFFRDDYQCRQETSMTSLQTTYTRPNILQPSGALTTSPMPQANPEMYLRCMAARGYTLQEVRQPSSLTPVSTPAPEPTKVTTPDPTKATTAGKKRDTKDVPLCAWGEYWHSVKKECVKIGSE